MNPEQNERRLPEVVIRYWDQLRGSRPLPMPEEIDADAIDKLGFWEDCFLIQVHDILGGDGYHYTYIGSHILEAYGEDLTGVSVYAFTSPSADSLALKYHEVIGAQVPITDEGEFFNARNIKVRYRQCLVPFGSHNRVDVIMGTMRYKLFPGG